jgi:HTH-type transcriptional regulator/antitoxin MqsA
VAIRGTTVSVSAEFYRCSGCGEERFDLEQVDRARTAAAEALTRAEGLLLPEDIRELRKRLGLTQEAFENSLGLGPKTVVRWESGKVIPSRAAALLLEALRRDPSLMRHFDALARGERPKEQVVSISAQPARKWQLSQQIELQASGFTGEYGVLAA